MKITELNKLLADAQGTARRVRAARREQAQWRRAMAHPAVTGLPAAFRSKISSQRQRKAVEAMAQTWRSPPT